MTPLLRTTHFPLLGSMISSATVELLIAIDEGGVWWLATG